jgi:hypothetical protein
MNAHPTPELDSRFSDSDAAPTPWSVAWQVLERAEMYIAADDAVYFCTGLGEQKGRNLQQNPHVAITTGNNTWAEGLDVIVEGTAVRVDDRAGLQRAADAYAAKYGSAWQFDVGDGVLTHGEQGEIGAALFRIEPTKVLAFAKAPHGQTRYRLGKQA